LKYVISSDVQSMSISSY